LHHDCVRHAKNFVVSRSETEIIMSWLNKSFSRSVSSGHYDVAALKGDVVDKVSAAIMMIDRDLVVTYVNGPTRELLRKNAAAFAAMWPGFDPEQIVGRCIDMFHKNPAHQRPKALRKLSLALRILPWVSNSITACILLIEASIPSFKRIVVTSCHSKTLPT
jgi:hypothetical protein